MRICSGNRFNYSIRWSLIEVQDSQYMYRDKEGYPRGIAVEQSIKYLTLDSFEYAV